MNLLQIARVSRWHRVCEQLLKENLVTTAQLAWCRDPSLPATIPLLSLFRLSQEFPIISGGQNTFAFIGEGVHPTSVSNLISQFGNTRPFPWPTGMASICSLVKVVNDAPLLYQALYLRASSRQYAKGVEWFICASRK